MTYVSRSLIYDLFLWGKRVATTAEKQEKGSLKAVEFHFFSSFSFLPPPPFSSFLVFNFPCSIRQSPVKSTSDITNFPSRMLAYIEFTDTP